MTTADSTKNWLRENLLHPFVPGPVKDRFIHINDSQLDQVRNSLMHNFFGKCSSGYLESPEGKGDVQDHLTGRLQDNRKFVIPWLNSQRPLKGARILEIGCGTGASTVALAEQGALVTGLDIDEAALNDLSRRCEIYDLKVDIVRGNATKLPELFEPNQFDIVIFYASLEHMTHEERIIALRDSWQALPENGILCIVDTPNRLWFFDQHTSALPFFDWLPDRLAQQYAKFSPREEFNSDFLEPTPESDVKFMRWGRGFSFHEIEVALTDVDLTPRSVSSMTSFTRQRLLSWFKWRISRQSRVENLLRSLRPDLDPGFFGPFLNLIIRKPELNS